MNLYVQDLLMVFNFVVILTVWFKTDAFVEWSKLFKLKCLHYEQFEKFRQMFTESEVFFPDYLLTTYSENFLVKLITCPVCLSVWLNLLWVGWMFFAFGPVSILLFGLNTFLTWMISFFIHRSMNE